jgi:hypothetical protein
MCEYILGGLIAGLVNVGPGQYLIQGITDDGKLHECVIKVEPKENDKNLSGLITL